MCASQLAFFAEQELITIIPVFSLDSTTGPVLHCIGVSWVPAHLRPNQKSMLKVLQLQVQLVR